MPDDVRKYLGLISEHLQEHHAAVLVGAGFSRNAIKIDESFPDSPTWPELARIFMKKLSADPEEQEGLSTLSPLVLAEYVEAVYGRPELNRLLLNSIPDQDILPSPLHQKLLQLPWSDVFTTNYDTLLERASEEIIDKQFCVVTNKEDLIGSSGTTRIVKLHGSFPSHYPFIITSEDYRTYPQRFAPFVNTVQQSLLENTLCLIGFSGDDPNFEKWIGWIKDNLGEDNAPNIFLLLHRRPSEAQQELFRRRKIIPVDLSQLVPGGEVSAIYENAINILLDGQASDPKQNWPSHYTFHDEKGNILSIEDTLADLQHLHKTYPGWLTVPYDRLHILQNIMLPNAEEVLSAYCKKDGSVSDVELSFLYEFDWLREKSLLPPFSSALRCYEIILGRHTSDHSEQKTAILLSLLRDERESGEWEKWNGTRDELKSFENLLNREQKHQLQWEECLCAFARYQFRELKNLLVNWDVSPDLPVWALRKACLLAEYGEAEQAQPLLQQAIFNLRRRISHSRRINLELLSLESAMMNLNRYISQAIRSNYISAEEQNSRTENLIDKQHSAFHAQHRVSWEDQNILFTSRLEAAWEPFRVHHVSPTFDFGKTTSNSQFGSDKEALLAFSFLRFREETGMPFFIRHIISDKKAAQGAAERIARYSPLWSILTVVRSDEPKAVRSVITRGILSAWTQEEVDSQCQFYLDAVVQTEAELAPEDWFYRNSFARLSANVLPEVLSELATRCSFNLLDQLLDLLKTLYLSPKRLCYQQTPSLLKHVISAYPPSMRDTLIRKLLQFPILDDDVRTLSYYPEPMAFLQTPSDAYKKEALEPWEEIEKLFSVEKEQKNQDAILSRLLYCFYEGLLTRSQKEQLAGMTWTKQHFQPPRRWLRTIALDLPHPEEVDVADYLCNEIVRGAENRSVKGIRIPQDTAPLLELRILSLTCKHVFSKEQVSFVLSNFLLRILSLTDNLAKGHDIMGSRNVAVAELYEIAHDLWLVTKNNDIWSPSEADKQTMSRIIEAFEASGIVHYGIRSSWLQHFDRTFYSAREFESCIRSVDEQQSRWSYIVLSTAIRYPDAHLLSGEEIHTGISTMAQQIAWCIPRCLASALQMAKVVVDYHSDLVTGEVLELIITGLSQLINQTKITIDDTQSSASEKGEVRMNAAALAKQMYQIALIGDRPEILEKWTAIINDKNEFSEIRCV